MVRYSLLFSSLMLLQHSNVVISQGIISVACPAASCQECIDQGCGWAPLVNACQTSCSFIADVGCYSPSDDYDVCAQVELDLASMDICRSVDTTCDACVNTLQADGVTPCQWHSPRNPEFALAGFPEYCGTGGCDMVGLCGTDTCPTVTEEATTAACTTLTTCGDCLQEGCAWTTNNVCQDECTDDQQLCYQETATGSDVQGTCAVLDTIQQEELVTCSARSDCSGCVSTVLSVEDGRTCTWFDGGDIGAYCGTGSTNDCDENGICGSKTCDGGPPTTIGTCADFNDSCAGCLDAGCSYSPAGGCLESCSFIADTSCFENVENVADTCFSVEQDLLDSAACSATEDCASCTSTALPSDASSSCRWFQDGDIAYCGNSQGCDFLGICGVSTCEDLPTVIGPPTICADNNDSCTGCLDAGCSYSPAGGCLESCSSIADTSCFENVENVADTCFAIEQDEMDSEACSALEDCANCTSTALPSDASSTCQWYQNGDFGYCGNSGGCDFNGICGVSTCEGLPPGGIEPTTSTLCSSNADSCAGCLDAGCAYSPVGACLDRCGLIADAPCYRNVANSTFTCFSIEQEKIDSQVCSVLQDCATCTSTVLPSNETLSCRWFQNGDRGYCGNSQDCDFLGICGSSTCDAVMPGAFMMDSPPLAELNTTATLLEDSASNATETTRAVNTTVCSFQVDCVSCLSNEGCAWYANGAICRGSEECDESSCGPALADTCFVSSAPSRLPHYWSMLWGAVAYAAWFFMAEAL